MSQVTSVFRIFAKASGKTSPSLLRFSTARGSFTHAARCTLISVACSSSWPERLDNQSSFSREFRGLSRELWQDRTKELRCACAKWNPMGVRSIKTKGINRAGRTSHVWVSWLVNWCFEPSQPRGIISGLKKTFIKRDILERTSKAKIRLEE